MRSLFTSELCSRRRHSMEGSDSKLLHRASTLGARGQVRVELGLFLSRQFTRSRSRTQFEIFLMRSHSFNASTSHRLSACSTQLSACSKGFRLDISGPSRDPGNDGF